MDALCQGTGEWFLWERSEKIQETVLKRRDTFWDKEEGALWKAECQEEEKGYSGSEKGSQKSKSSG